LALWWRGDRKAARRREAGGNELDRNWTSRFTDA
jgi:hypothetical protein